MWGADRMWYRSTRSLTTDAATTSAGSIATLHLKVPVQTTLSVARTKSPMDVPERLTPISHLAEFLVLLSSPGRFCLVVFWTHFANGVFALA